MTALLLTACVGMITGAFLIFRISPMDFTLGVFRRLTAGPKSIRDEINETTHRKKPGFFRREISEAQTVLQATGKEERFPVLCAASLLLFAVGAGIAIIMNNLLLVPVLAAGMMFLPFWYIKLTAGHYRKAVTAELETALSIITTAYLRSEDLQTAVEENINYLNPPVYGVFRSFLTRIKHIDPDMNAALAELKSAIDNEVWREWCEALSACQYDHSMKSTLNPIVGKLSDMRIINGELENLVFAPRKEFISMAALVVLIPKPILGGAGIVMFGMVAVSGIRTLGQVNYRNNNNGMVVALTLGLGMMPVLVPNLFTQFPPMVQLFLHSGITIGTLTAIVANLTLNGSVPFRVNHETPVPDPAPPSSAARNMAVRTVRMWLLLRKVQKERQPEEAQEG